MPSLQGRPRRRNLGSEFVGVKCRAQLPGAGKEAGCSEAWALGGSGTVFLAFWLHFWDSAWPQYSNFKCVFKLLALLLLLHPWPRHLGPGTALGEDVAWGYLLFQVLLVSLRCLSFLEAEWAV